MVHDRSAITIAVDARTVFARARRGTGKNLIDAYRALAEIRPQWRLLMYHRTPGVPNPFEGWPTVVPRMLRMPGDRWDLWQHLGLPQAARRDGARLLHCPANSCPRFGGVPVVSTVHDLIPLKIADPGAPPAGSFRAAIRRCLRRSRRIIAVSHATRRDLISDFGAAPQQITVIGWAADSSCGVVRDRAELAAVRSRYNMTRPYVLAFSGRSRRKNTEGMIRAFALLDPELRRRFAFVIIGVEPAARRAQLTALIEALGVADGCRLHGFVPEADVPALLCAAEVLAFCSLYEGFGLPILDAFRCETAVLTSRVSSMPEVAGDAAVYCDPSEPASIAAGLSRLLSEPQLGRECVRRGRERLQQYSWRRTAETMVDVFEECV